jgi:hypothetical protein
MSQVVNRLIDAELRRLPQILEREESKAGYDWGRRRTPPMYQ